MLWFKPTLDTFFNIGIFLVNMFFPYLQLIKKRYKGILFYSWLCAMVPEIFLCFQNKFNKEEYFFALLSYFHIKY